MADKTYVTTTAGVRIYNADRSQATDLLAVGATVPADADSDHLQHLLGLGLIEEGATTGGLDVDPDVPPPFPAPAAPQRTSSYDGTSAPAKSASKADWLDWAQKVEGVAPESDEGKALGEKTRDELAETYADRSPAPAGT